MGHGSPVCLNPRNELTSDTPKNNGIINHIQAPKPPKKVGFVENQGFPSKIPPRLLPPDSLHKWPEANEVSSPVGAGESLGVIRINVELCRVNI